MANGRVREYIGARYVPVFANPVTWDDERAYEPLTMVQYSGETYMSKQYVPIGAPLPTVAQGEESNEYWVHMSNWNAQVEAYREEVLRYAEEVLLFDGRIDTLEADLPTSEFDSTNTVKKYVDDEIDSLENVLPISQFDSNNTVKKAIEKLKGAGTLFATNYLGSWINHSYAESSLGALHAGSITKYTENIEVCISCPYTDNVNNLGEVRFISIENNALDILPKKEVTLYHANSITFLPDENKFLIAPVFDTSGGSRQSTEFLIKYDTTFTNMEIIQTPDVVVYGVAYDYILEKTYCVSGNNIYELNNDGLTLVGSTDSYNAAQGNHVQDFAIRNGVWYVSNTCGNIAYGTLDNGLQGSFNISKYDSFNDYYLFGEVDGMDFTEDGNLICMGDYDIPSVGHMHTVFEIVTPITPTPIYYLSHQSPMSTSIQVAKTTNANILRQIISSGFSDITQINFSANEIGSTIRIVLLEDYIATNETINLSNFSNVVIDTNGHTLYVDRIRWDGATFTIQGNGTFHLKRDVWAPAKGYGFYNIRGGVTYLTDKVDQMMFASSTGAMVGVGSSTNSSGVKFPNTDVFDINHVYFQGRIGEYVS